MSRKIDEEDLDKDLLQRFSIKKNFDYKELPK
jgi:hypothetical protein